MQDVYETRFKNLQPNITEEQQKANSLYLIEQLDERKQLSEMIKKREIERKEKENEFLKKQRVVDEFPHILEKLE